MEYDETYAESSIGGQSLIVNLLCHENWGVGGGRRRPKDWVVGGGNGGKES